MMGEARARHLSGTLATLEGLDDEDLFTVMARAQVLLLNRPVSPHSGAGLSVEVVNGEEGRLLTTYRALAPAARDRVLAQVAGLVDAAQRPVPPLAPIAREPVGV